MQVLRGEHAWLEQGIVGLVPDDPTEADTVELPTPRAGAARETQEV